MKESQIVIRDTGESGTPDRYTAYKRHTPKGEHQGRFVPMIGFSANPFHPHGLGSHEMGLPGPHLGKQIKMSDLPINAAAFVATEYEIEGYTEAINSER